MDIPSGTYDNRLSLKTGQSSHGQLNWRSEDPVKLFFLKAAALRVQARI